MGILKNTAEFNKMAMENKAGIEEKKAGIERTLTEVEEESDLDMFSGKRPKKSHERKPPESKIDSRNT